MAQIRKIYMNRTSACVSLPAPVLSAAGLQRGDYVHIGVDEARRVVITKVGSNIIDGTEEEERYAA